MPWDPLLMSNNLMPASRQFRSSAASICSAINPQTADADRAWARCDRPWRSCGTETSPATPAPCIMSNACGAGDLVNEMEADEELRLAGWECPDCVRVPNFVQQGRGHRLTCYYVARGSGLGTRGSGLGARDSGLGARDSGLGARGSGLGTRGSGLGARDSGSGLGARGSIGGSNARTAT